MAKVQTVIPIPMSVSSAFLVKGDHSVLVDVGYPGNGERVMEALSKETDPKDVSLILITHGHRDHFGSLPEVIGRLNAKVAIGAKDREALLTGKSAMKPKGMVPSLVSKFINMGNGSWKPIEPDILIDGEMDLAPFGVDGMVIPTPGHTLGSVSVLLPSGEALVGDLISGKTKPSYPFFVEEQSLVDDSLRTLLARNVKTFYGAHGGPYNAEDVREFLER